MSSLRNNQVYLDALPKRGLAQVQVTLRESDVPALKCAAALSRASQKTIAESFAQVEQFLHFAAEQGVKPEQLMTGGALLKKLADEFHGRLSEPNSKSCPTDTAQPFRDGRTRDVRQGPKTPWTISNKT